MSVTLLKKDHTRLRVKDCALPLATSELLGSGIDVMTLPEGHMACAKCKGYKWEAWVHLDNHRLEMGCLQCGASYRLLFPLDIDLNVFGKSGRYSCLRKKSGHYVHEQKGMILIHNSGTICIGCESCNSEVRITLRTESNIIIPESVN